MEGIVKRTRCHDILKEILENIEKRSAFGGTESKAMLIFATHLCVLDEISKDELGASAGLVSVAFLNVHQSILQTENLLFVSCLTTH